MNKIKTIIEDMNPEELQELKEQINKGHFQKSIDKRLEIFKNPNQVCPVCNSAVGAEGLTLIFGSIDLKQKATFDAVDCLEYFIYKINKKQY